MRARYVAVMTAKNNKKIKIGRLKKRSDFLWVQEQSRKNDQKWVSKTAILQIAKNINKYDDGVRYGLTVSKRVDKKAVNRNRIKRRLRAVLDDLLVDYVDQGLDIVVIGRPLTLKAPLEDIDKDIRWCLKRLEVKPS